MPFSAFNAKMDKAKRFVGSPRQNDVNLLLGGTLSAWLGFLRISRRLFRFICSELSDTSWLSWSIWRGRGARQREAATFPWHLVIGRDKESYSDWFRTKGQLVSLSRGVFAPRLAVIYATRCPEGIV